VSVQADTALEMFAAGIAAFLSLYGWMLCLAAIIWAFGQRKDRP